MFTGIIETTGAILGIEERMGARRIAISAPGIAPRLETGGSVSVSGVCLTALDIGKDRFFADLAAETVERTSLTRLAQGTIVNLELPTPAGAPLGGHVVQGHVDATGTVLSFVPVNPEARPGETDWRLRIAVPENVGRYVVEKGSIAVEGISLTVAGWERDTPAGDVLSIAVIPHTWARTNLRTIRAGQPVNLEADVQMKLLLEKREAKTFDLTLEYLAANGY